MNPLLLRLFPFMRWQRPNRDILKADFSAGLAVALVLVPQSMAYAALAGLPPVYGLYASLLPVIVAALWGSSNHLATGPVAVVSLLTATALIPLASPGSGEFIALAIVLAFLVGVIQLSMGLLRMGALVSFISHPVIVGFTNAAALIIGLSQLNKLLGGSDRHQRALHGRPLGRPDRVDPPPLGHTGFRRGRHPDHGRHEAIRS
jgi:sulfate permease, SulP family